MTQFDDSLWQDVTDFLQAHLQPGEQLLAPVEFAAVFPIAQPYDISYLVEAQQFSWVLLHKGLLEKMSLAFLKQTIATFTPVFANQVFVLFSQAAVPAKDFDGRHLRPLWDWVAPPPRLRIIDGDHSAKRLVRAVRQWGRRRLSQSPPESGKLTAVLERLVHVERSLTHLEQEVQAQREVQIQMQQRRTLIHNSAAIATMSAQEFREICRAACQTAYLGNDTMLCRVLGKYFLYAEAQDIGIVPHLCLNGYWETWLTLAMARVLQPGWVCIDVGANHGYYTLLMAGIAGQTGRVMAIEPTPRLAALLHQTLSVNGVQHWTTVVQAAAFDQAGTINLTIPRGLGMNASVTRAVAPSDQVIEVETFTLDQFTEGWQQLNLIKIDAEGAEENIWRGMQATIDRHPAVTIILEFNCARYADPAAFLHAIQDKGFPLQHIDFDAEVKPLTVEQCLRDRPTDDWLLFLRRPEL